MFEEKDDTIMARWLAGELSDNERAEFEASAEHKEYERLANGLKAFEKPIYEKEALREKIWQALEQPRPSNVIPLRPFYYAVGIAASLVLLFGLFFYEVSYSTGVGEKMLVALPDGTEVHLNANSSLTRNRFFWKENKTVELQGEGFFRVTKGEGFIAKTTKGNIHVLGTEFNIKTRTNALEVYCFEGKVLYENEEIAQESILTAGDAISLKNNILIEYKHTRNSPEWPMGRSSFSNSELLEVMQELEIQYGIVFTYEDEIIQGHFTGTFIHDNLQLALKSVFIPMGITYELSKDQKTVTLNAR